METTAETETTEATAASTTTAEKLPVNINAFNSMLLTGCLLGEAREAWDRGDGFCWTRDDIETIIRGIDEAIADLGPDSCIVETLREKRRAFAEAING